MTNPNLPHLSQLTLTDDEILVLNALVGCGITKFRNSLQGELDATIRVHEIRELMGAEPFVSLTKKLNELAVHQSKYEVTEDPF